MNREDEVLAVAAVLIIKKLREPKKRRPNKSWIEKKATYSHINLIRELVNQPDDFRSYLRMDETTYRNLLHLVTPIIQKTDTVMKSSITPHERLTATLRFLATGRTYEDLKFSTCISKSALSKIIPETCDAIYTVLKQEYLKFPKTTAEWKNIALDFQEKWNFPHCLGAVDGKHVQIRTPPGKVVVPGQPHLNYVFVGDEAFAMRPDFLKPYNQRELNNEKRIFNYRLSRARRIIENTFGILANRFRIFHTSINLKLDNIDKVVLACCALHNFLRRNSANSYTPNDVFDFEDISTGTTTPGLWTQPENLLNPASSHSRHHSAEAKDVRTSFKNYFNSS
ncbi:uncharacterized protein LOC126735303 [Anthonomus grandis grandis]|uniref:uncharacterized protein LOC126735303 n=1 Tax=Anthonomus grandis grandis TaxID=2921223 RepID=UPI0021657D9B|nr:uncharacterized protein LOC126735303 [Anthonomus grandis grandis]